MKDDYDFIRRLKIVASSFGLYVDSFSIFLARVPHLSKTSNWRCSPFWKERFFPDNSENQEKNKEKDV